MKRRWRSWRGFSMRLRTCRGRRCRPWSRHEFCFRRRGLTPIGPCPPCVRPRKQYITHSTGIDLVYPVPETIQTKPTGSEGAAPDPRQPVSRGHHRDRTSWRDNMTVYRTRRPITALPSFVTTTTARGRLAAIAALLLLPLAACTGSAPNGSQADIDGPVHVCSSCHGLDGKSINPTF